MQTASFGQVETFESSASSRDTLRVSSHSIFFRLVGDVLLATGFLSYSGPFNQAFRTLLLDNWKKEMRKMKIPFSEVMLYEKNYEELHNLSS